MSSSCPQTYLQYWSPAIFYHNNRPHLQLSHRKISQNKLRTHNWQKTTETVWLQFMTSGCNPPSNQTQRIHGGRKKKKKEQTHITGILIKQDRVVNTQIKQKHIPSYFDRGKKTETVTEICRTPDISSRIITTSPGQFYTVQCVFFFCVSHPM